jgi:excisionase family DNA binding protein
MIPTGMNPGQLLISPKDVAAILSISPRKLWSLTASGEIPHLKIGRSVRYPLTDLQQWIELQKKGGDQ